MSLVKIRFEVMNEVQLSRAFEVVGNKIKDLSKPFMSMADDFYQSMAKTFESEGASEDKKQWEDLSPAYARWKQRNYPGRKILERTGVLKRSLTTKGSMNGVLDITPSQMSIGTRVPYASYHQTGTSKMPMRKVIELSAEQKKRWTRIARDFIFNTVEEEAKKTRRQ